jgi:hypothetical protein
VFTFTVGAFSGHSPVRLDGAVAGRMLSAVAASRIALGSYVAMYLTSKALPQSTRPIIQFALKDFPLSDQTFVNDLISILGPCELNDD